MLNNKIHEVSNKEFVLLHISRDKVIQRHIYKCQYDGCHSEHVYFDKIHAFLLDHKQAFELRDFGPIRDSKTVKHNLNNIYRN